jgi:hypothetical protein
MRRENAEIIVNTILEGCPPPCLILGQEDCSRLESSRTKEVLQAGNHDAFFKDLPQTLFRGHYSQLWKDFRPNQTNTILIDDMAEKGALCDNGNVVVLPTWGGPLMKQMYLRHSLLPQLQDLTSSDELIAKLVRKNRHGLSPVPSLEFFWKMRLFEKVIF